MTHSEILSMQPGPELDDEIAVMLGWRWVQLSTRRGKPWNLIPPSQAATWLPEYVFERCPEPGNVFQSGIGRPRYSTSIADAWLVVEAMAAKGWELELRYNGKRAIADFHSHGRCRRVKYETAPHAVCIAARLAMEADYA